MKLEEIYSQNRQVISFEVFPPKTDFGNKVKNLEKELNCLMKYKPSLISVTHGAGGTYSGNSLTLVKILRENFDISVMPHFTCINATKNSVKEFLGELEKIGTDNILALRGDIPKDIPYICEDFKHADELVSYIKENTKLSAAVAGYPEKHPEAVSLEEDINYLKNKTSKGAKFVFTQLFFDNDVFKSYFEKVKTVCPELTVIPGILPLSSYSQVTRMFSLCGTKIPKKLSEKIEKFKDLPEDFRKLGVETATEQIKDLQNYGIKNFHLYTLNKSEQVSAILDEIREY